MRKAHRIGVLTGGGDCPGLNAVIRSVTKSAINGYQFEVYGFLDGFKGLVENEYVKLNLKSVSGIAHLGGTILGSSNRDNPFRYYRMVDGVETFTDESDRAIAHLQNLEIDGLIIIGGDGSLHIAQNFFEKGVKVVGVPKTIDNDLSATDVTFGFYTAVTTATDAIDKLHTTAEAHHRVMILELMGRYAGWISLYAGLAGGADVILIPEIPYSLDAVINKIRQRREHDKHFSIVVVAEGARPLDGEMTVQRMVSSSHDPVRLGGIGNKLAFDIEEQSGIESRVTVLGHLQRGGSPVAYDRVIASRYGAAAVECFARGAYGTMVSLRGEDIIPVPISEAISSLKQVTAQSQVIRTARLIGISFGDEDE